MDDEFYEAILRRIPAHPERPWWDEAAKQAARVASTTQEELRQQHRQELYDELIARVESEAEQQQWDKNNEQWCIYDWIRHQKEQESQ
jgi:2-phosphoglycerate kinase